MKTKRFCIGDSYAHAGTSFAGAIEFLRIYSNELTATQITALQTAPSQRIEVFDDRFQTDATVFYDGVTASTIAGLAVDAGKIVGVKDWNAWRGNHIVPDTGILALTIPTRRVYAGLPYICTAKTLPIPFMPLNQKQIAQIGVRVVRTRSLNLNNKELVFQHSTDEEGSPPAEFTGTKFIENLGLDHDAGITMQQRLPYPATVLSLYSRLMTGD